MPMEHHTEKKMKLFIEDKCYSILEDFPIFHFLLTSLFFSRIVLDKHNTSRVWYLGLSTTQILLQAYQPPLELLQ